ncbi:MAG: ribbon-helix-helix domain-containing protein [Actinomycetota bacterium]|nr:ribbon-helix-helix domain-containing protein [Actinomycetota bacterium]
MAHLSRRVQILLDEERYARLERRAQRRGASVAALIREAVDTAFPPEDQDPEQAARVLLDAEPIPVDDWPAMKNELLATRYRRFE